MALWKTEGLEVGLEERERINRAAERAERANLAARRHLDMAARRAEDAARSAQKAAAELDAAGGATDERCEFVSVAVALVGLQRRLQKSADARGSMAAAEFLGASQ